MKDEKLDYIAPEADVETIGQEDIVLISTKDEEYDLDKNGSFKWGEW